MFTIYYGYVNRQGESIDIADNGIWGVETSNGHQYDEFEDALVFEGIVAGPSRKEVYPD